MSSIALRHILLRHSGSVTPELAFLFLFQSPSPTPQTKVIDVCSYTQLLQESGVPTQVLIHGQQALLSTKSSPRPQYGFLLSVALGI